MGFWQAINRGLYRGWRIAQAKVVMPNPIAVPIPIQGEGKGILVLAWGRIGDAVLATGFLRQIRALVPGEPLHLVGRPEVEPVVTGLVDRFVPWEQEGALAIAQPYRMALGDAHLFYGGTRATCAWLDQVPARKRFVYEGYHQGPGLEPKPWFPPEWEVIPAKANSSALAERHLTQHQDHYLTGVCQALGVDLPQESRPSLSHLDLDPGTSAHFHLPNDYLSLQAISNNPKKDWPLERFAEVLTAFPDQRFVALGSPREGELLQALQAPNLISLAGKTTLRESLAVIKHARAHLGLDSGLTHAAAVLGRPTVCVAQSSNLGFFFPYPDGLAPELHTVDHENYRSCSGCFMTCAHEPIWRTRSLGALCLRTLPVASVIDTLRSLLSKAEGSP